MLKLYYEKILHYTFAFNYICCTRDNKILCKLCRILYSICLSNGDRHHLYSFAMSKT